MVKEERKDVKMSMKGYEVLKDYSESRGITLGEAVQHMKDDIDLLKSHELISISDNALMFCDQVEALADCARLPSWLSDAIKATMRPIILKGMVNNQPIDFDSLRSVWEIPAQTRLVTKIFQEG